MGIKYEVRLKIERCDEDEGEYESIGDEVIAASFWTERKAARQMKVLEEISKAIISRIEL